MHGAWNGFTGIHASLYKASDDKNPEWNVDACVNYWLEQGAPKSKLVVGIPTYGRSFRLANQANNGVHALSTGPGDAGPYTRESGFLGYNEICVNNWIAFWDSIRKVPYAFEGPLWVGYDNVKSITVKCNYVIEHDLAGSMIWSLETDDFRGTCGFGEYPLLSKISEIMKSGVCKI
jgi:chitinase